MLALGVVTGECDPVRSFKHAYDRMLSDLTSNAPEGTTRIYNVQFQRLSSDPLYFRLVGTGDAYRPARETMELSDDWHNDEPAAFMVKNAAPDAAGEYKIFIDEIAAKTHARHQAEWADEDDEFDDRIWPLYPGSPIE
jgi:hypothetical protein